MFRTVFRFVLALLAVAAIAFGIWYYFAVYETRAAVHGTLVHVPMKQYMIAERMDSAEPKEILRDCFLQKNGESAV